MWYVLGSMDAHAFCEFPACTPACSRTPHQIASTLGAVCSSPSPRRARSSCWQTRRESVELRTRSTPRDMLSSPWRGAAVLLAAVVTLAFADSAPPPVVVVRLPNTAKVDGQLTANLGVDHFFSLWIVFNNDDVVISGKSETKLLPVYARAEKK